MLVKCVSVYLCIPSCYLLYNGADEIEHSINSSYEGGGESLELYVGHKIVRLGSTILFFII